jgi:putative oxidoreductase
MSMSVQSWSSVGLLTLRAGLGISLLSAHGLDKLLGGMAKWERIGGAGMSWTGIEIGQVYFGAFASVSESIFAVMVAIGLRTRSAAACIAATMFMAMMMHLVGGDTFSKASHAFELCVAFGAISLMGAGRLSVDGWLAARRSQAG